MKWQVTPAQWTLFTYLQDKYIDCFLGELADEVFHQFGRAVYDAFCDLGGNTVADALAYLTNPTYLEHYPISRQMAYPVSKIHVKEEGWIIPTSDQFFIWNRHPERGYTVLQRWEAHPEEQTATLQGQWTPSNILTYYYGEEGA